MNADATSSRQIAGFIHNRRSRNLFLQTTVPATETNAAAIFCAPFSEERQKSYRAHYHLAQSLAEQGVACFRFDYLGTGDSDGDSIDTSIDSMVKDTCDVVAYVAAEHAVDRLYLIGTRLGATIAALAAEQSIELAGIALLFPVVDGGGYWAELLRQQQLEVLGAGLKPMARSEFARRLDERGYVEIESNRVGRHMVAELAKLDLRQMPVRFRGKVLAVFLHSEKPTRDQTTDILANYEKCSCRTQWWHDEAREYWTLRSMYDYYLPSNTFRHVSDWLQA